MFFVYVLKSEKTGRRYIGYTNNIERRLKEHNSNQNPSTKNRGPWQLVHSEEYKSLNDVLEREKYLKSGAGREYLDDVANMEK